MVTKKKTKPKDPNLSSMPTRKYVRAIAKALNIKLERKLMQKDYCQSFINKYKLQYLIYVNENNVTLPSTEKQRRYIEKMKKVLCHYYKDSELYTPCSTIDEAKEWIIKWKDIYHSLVSSYYKSSEGR